MPCNSPVDVLDILTFFVAVAALILSIRQFSYEKSRTRKEATIHAFDQLSTNQSVVVLFELCKTDVDRLINCYNNHDNRADFSRSWTQVNSALPLIEHFAVGINNSVYDLSILNSMAGNQLISTFFNCERLYDLKRFGYGRENNYKETEKMIKCLIEYRKKNGQSIPKKS